MDDRIVPVDALLPNTEHPEAGLRTRLMFETYEVHVRGGFSDVRFEGCEGTQAEAVASAGFVDEMIVTLDVYPVDYWLHGVGALPAPTEGSNGDDNGALDTDTDGALDTDIDGATDTDTDSDGAPDIDGGTDTDGDGDTDNDADTDTDAGTGGEGIDRPYRWIYSGSVELRAGTARLRVPLYASWKPWDGGPGDLRDRSDEQMLLTEITTIHKMTVPNP